MLSLSHIFLVLLIILIVFGAGKLPQIMGELGAGIKNFRDSLKISKDEEKDL
jgi:sec-independent protein translocase protein TatA